MHRKILFALLATALTTPAFAQDVEKKKTKKADAAAKQEEKKKAKPQADTQKTKAEERKKKAAERKKKAAAARRKKQPSFVMNMMKPIKLTSQQEPKVKEIAKKFDPKFVALRTKQASILTAEQKKAMADARSKQRAARKAGTGKPDGEKKKSTEKGNRRGSNNAVKLTEAQRKQRQDIATEQKKLRGEVVAALGKVLTAEQKELLPGAGRTRKGAGKKKRKKPESGESKKKAEAKKKKKSDDK